MNEDYRSLHVTYDRDDLDQGRVVVGTRGSAMRLPVESAPDLLRQAADRIEQLWEAGTWS